jgi:DNA-binding phage protein
LSAEEIETNDHVLMCRKYTSFRTAKDLKKDEDVIKYFKEVMNEREKIEEEKKKKI